MPHLTIFGMNYAPEITGNAPYTTSVAEHAASSGWEVDVHTGYPHYPEWRKLKAAATEVSNSVTIHRHRHSVPSTPTAIGRAMMDLTWAATALPSAVLHRETDVALAVIPHLLEPWVALSSARRSRVPVVTWFQDLMGRAASQSGVRGGHRVAGVVQRTELAAARRADAVIVAADGFRPYLLQGGVDSSCIHVVRNWSLLEASSTPRIQARARLGFGEGETVAVHSGNMGAKQGLGVVLDAATAAPDVTFVLQGNGSERSMLEHAAAMRALANVQFLPLLAGEDLADLLIAADVLLLTQRDSVTDMSLPSKLTTYLATGLPIVASVNPTSEAAILLTTVGRGVLVEAGSPTAMADAVRAASNHSPAASSVDTQHFGSPAQIERILRKTVTGPT